MEKLNQDEPRFASSGVVQGMETEQPPAGPAGRTLQGKVIWREGRRQAQLGMDFERSFCPV